MAALPSDSAGNNPHAGYYVSNRDINSSRETTNPYVYKNDFAEEAEEEEEMDGETLPLVKEKPQLTSNCQTLMNLIKGNIGAGILSMPDAFKNSGLLLGSIGIPIMGLICIHCMHILVSCSRLLSERTAIYPLDYARVTQYAFKTGPGPFPQYYYVARKIVNGFLLLTQLGFCCVYYLFIAKNLNQVVDFYYPDSLLNIYHYLLMLLPLFILYSFVRNLRHLSLTSTFANVLQITSLFIIFYNLLQHPPPISERTLVAEPGNWPLYFGTAVFAFEGISVVLPIENEMKTPEAFGGSVGVLNTGMVVVTCFYLATGFFGYLRYGDNVAGSITLNLPGHWVYNLVRVMFSVSLFFSYGLQIYVPLKFIWPFLRKKLHLAQRCSPWVLTLLEYSIRVFLVLVTFGLAAAIPRLELFIALVGAVASSSLALIFPPFLEIITYWQEDISRNWRMFLVGKNVVIMLFGFVGFLTGTYVSIEQVIDAFQANSTLINTTTTTLT